MHIDAGWLQGVVHTPSENHDERPDNEISLLVVHCISLPAGHYGAPYVEQLFCNTIDVNCHPDFADLEGVRVASHLYINRLGVIQQFVPFHKRAWHAGESTFQGRTQCNDFSIGVELEGTDTADFRDVQYQSLIDVSRELVNHYSIPTTHIVGHSDIAPGRKSDPGTQFDWQRFRQGLVDLRSK